MGAATEPKGNENQAARWTVTHKAVQPKVHTAKSLQPIVEVWFHPSSAKAPVHVSISLGVPQGTTPATIPIRCTASRRAARTWLQGSLRLLKYIQSVVSMRLRCNVDLLWADRINL